MTGVEVKNTKRIYLIFHHKIRTVQRLSAPSYKRWGLGCSTSREGGRGRGERGARRGRGEGRRGKGERGRGEEGVVDITKPH